ncbi:MAG: M23 family metallopeptidase [Lachnospiraceae bacterium]|nr:M23 family metallopeptidase [Lachnospiraceae bacterium]
MPKNKNKYRRRPKESFREPVRMEEEPENIIEEQVKDEPEPEAEEQVKEEPEPEAEEQVKEEPEPEAEKQVKDEPEPEAEEQVRDEPEPEAEEPVKDEPEPEAEEPVKDEPEPEAEEQVKDEPEPEAEEPVKDEPEPEAEERNPDIVRKIRERNGTPPPQSRQIRRPERYNILFVSEDGQNVRSIHTSSDFLLLIMILAAFLVVGAIGYILYSESREDDYRQTNESLEEMVHSLSEDIIVLEADKEKLLNELRVANALLETGVAKHEEKGNASVNLKAVPGGLPVDGAVAVPSPYSVEKQYITFMTGAGTKVVAAGEGHVSYAGESVEFGYAVKIDHGNGYVTSYYEDTPPSVKEGDLVKRGDMLYQIEEDNQTLTYQVSYEDQYIDPYTVMEIDG